MIRLLSGGSVSGHCAVYLAMLWRDAQLRKAMHKIYTPVADSVVGALLLHLVYLSH
jgi:hypothetical protein